MAKAMGETTLGEYLVRENLITQAQLNKAMEQQRQTTRSLGRILVETNLITESMRMTILQKQFGFELVRLKDVQIDPLLLSMVPYAFAEKHRVVPLKTENRTLVVAMEDPSDILLLDAFKNQIGMAIQPVVASQEDIQLILNQYQTGAEAELQRRLDDEERRRPGLLFRFLRAIAFPILALLPLAMFIGGIATNANGMGDWLSRQHSEGIVTWFDVGLYILLVWGLWTIILYYINALIFYPRGSQPDEEAA